MLQSTRSTPGFEAGTERLISAGRVVLASLSLFATWLDPSDPPRYAPLAYLSMVVYVLYAWGIALVVWGSYRPLVRLRLITHVFDGGIFVLFVYFTEGATSPFFVYFVFSVLCATLRWQWRGTLWTAVVLLAAYLGTGVYAREILRDPQIELGRFITRAVYLSVVAILLGYLGAHEFQRRKQLSRLAAWWPHPPTEVENGIARLLEHAAGVLDAPRVLMAWEEPEEPWLNLATFSDGQFQPGRRPLGSLSPLVAEQLEGKSFFSRDVRASMAMVIDAVSSEARGWRGEPLNRDLEQLFDIRSVLSVSVAGENFQGRLFFLDKSLLGSDDFVLAEAVGSQAAATLNLFYFSQHLQQRAATGMRVARNLHGLLQSLTGAGLQLQTVLQVSKADPEAALEQLRKIQNLILKEQRDLRSFVEQLELAPLVSGEGDFKLGNRLEELAKVLEQQWNLRVHVKLEGSEADVSATLAREIYRLVREGLVNAARHSGVSTALAELEVQEHVVRINVSDDGYGFDDRAGPVALRSRVASLGGSLRIHPGESGARLEIEIPL